MRFRELPPKSDERRDVCIQKYRKLLAIMAVAMETPIYASRHMPEVIYLTWFFGFPSFGREQEMGRFRRIPADMKNVADIFGQGVLFKREDLGSNDFQPGDEHFEALKEEIRGNVKETLKGAKV